MKQNKKWTLVRIGEEAGKADDIYKNALDNYNEIARDLVEAGRVLAHARLNRETAINKARDLLKVRERESGQTDTRPEITKAQTDIKAGISDRFGSIPGVIVSGI